MARETIAQQITRLESALGTIRTALTTARTGGGVASFSLGDMSVTNARISDLVAEETRLDKQLQRLYRGGRGIIIDHSANGQVPA